MTATTVEEDPERFFVQLAEELDEDFAVRGSTATADHGAVFFGDDNRSIAMAIAWKPQEGFFYDLTPYDHGGGDWVLSGNYEPMRSTPGPNGPLTAGFIAMVAANRLMDLEHDALTLRATNHDHAQFATNLAARLRAATEGDEFTDDDAFGHGDSFEGFTVAHEEWDDSVFAVVLEDEDTDTELAIAWVQAIGFVVDLDPEVDADEGYMPSPEVEETALTDQSPTSDIVAATLERLRQRREAV